MRVNKHTVDCKGQCFIYSFHMSCGQHLKMKMIQQLFVGCFFIVIDNKNITCWISMAAKILITEVSLFKEGSFRIC